MGLSGRLKILNCKTNWESTVFPVKLSLFVVFTSLSRQCVSRMRWIRKVKDMIYLRFIEISFTVDTEISVTWDSEILVTWDSEIWVTWDSEIWVTWGPEIWVTENPGIWVKSDPETWIKREI